MKPSLAERLYALSLYLYPPSFRREFGEQMKLAFRDRLRERRAPASRFLLDMTRDTVSAVAREHAHSPQASLRVLALLALMFAAATIFLRGESLRMALIDGVIAHQESVRKAALLAQDRAVHDYDANIADRYAVRHDARSQLVAAQFYGESFDFFGITAEDDAGRREIAAHRTQLAGEALDNALREGWNDPVILWNAAASCAAPGGVCRSPGALAQLRAVAPDNGAVGWLEFVAADRAKDAARARAAIAKIAASRDFTVYENAMTALWIDAYASVAPPRFGPDALEMNSPDDVVASGLYTRLSYLEWTVAMGTYAFERTCGSPDAALRDDCLRAAGLLAKSDIFAARFAGLVTLARLDPSGAPGYRAAWRKAMWSRTTLWKLLYDTDRDAASRPVDTRHWLAVLREHGNLVAAADAVTAASAAPQAPAGWADGWTVQ